MLDNNKKVGYNLRMKEFINSLKVDAVNHVPHHLDVGGLVSISIMKSECGYFGEYRTVDRAYPIGGLNLSGGFWMYNSFEEVKRAVYGTMRRLMK